MCSKALIVCIFSKMIFFLGRTSYLMCVVTSSNQNKTDVYFLLCVNRVAESTRTPP